MNSLRLSVPQYGHISLLVGDDGAPLSKRHGSASVRDLGKEGYLPAAVRNYMARLGHVYSRDGWLSDDTLISDFSVARLVKSPARFDTRQLFHWQHEAVTHASVDELGDWLGSVLPDDLGVSPRQ